MRSLPKTYKYFSVGWAREEKKKGLDKITVSELDWIGLDWIEAESNQKFSHIICSVLYFAFVFSPLLLSYSFFSLCISLRRIGS